MTSSQSSLLTPHSHSRYSSLITHHWFDSVWLLTLAIYVLSGTPSVPFHGDEATLIYMSKDYTYQFIQRDLSRIYYSETPVSQTQQELRLLNGTISKYLIGLAWHMGGFRLEDINEQWDWGADWNYNQQNGHAPSDVLLRTARWPSALLTAGGVGVIFALGWTLGGRKTAYHASLLYTVNPAILLNGRRAMMEGSLLLFTTLTMLAAVWFLRSPSWRRTIMLGVVAGLATASKHTSLFTVGSVFAGCAIYPIILQLRGRTQYPNSRQFTKPLAMVIAAGILTTGTFYLLNPAWWGADPFTVGRYVLQIRERTLNDQIAAFGSYGNFGDQLAGFARQVLVGVPQYYEVSNWQNFIGEQITQYEASVWRGVNVGGSLVGLVLLSVSMGIGAWALAFNKNTPRSTRWVCAVWTLGVVAATLLLTPFEWQRYYLPAFPAVILLAAYGLSYVLELAVAMLLRRRTIRGN